MSAGISDIKIVHKFAEVISCARWLNDSRAWSQRSMHIAIQLFRKQFTVWPCRITIQLYCFCLLHDVERHLL